MSKVGKDRGAEIVTIIILLVILVIAILNHDNSVAPTTFPSPFAAPSPTQSHFAANETDAWLIEQIDKHQSEIDSLTSRIAVLESLLATPAPQ